MLNSIPKDQRLPRLGVNPLLAALKSVLAQQRLKTGGELLLTGVTTADSPKKVLSIKL